MNGGLNKNDGWQRPTCPLPPLKRTQTWPYANSQTQNISVMALILLCKWLPLKQRIWATEYEKKTRTKPDIDYYQPAVPYRRLCAYKTWHHLQCHLRPPWSGHCERIKKGFVGGSTNMIVLQNSKQIAQYVDSGGFTSTRSWCCSDGKTRVPIDLVPLAATRERMHLMSAYLQSNISSESFFNQTRSPASTPGHAHLSLS